MADQPRESVTNSKQQSPAKDQELAEESKLNTQPILDTESRNVSSSLEVQSLSEMGASAKQQPKGTITPQANQGIDKKLRTLDRVKSNKVIETTLEVDKEHKDSDEDSSGEG